MHAFRRGARRSSMDVRRRAADREILLVKVNRREVKAWGQGVEKSARQQEPSGKVCIQCNNRAHPAQALTPSPTAQVTSLLEEGEPIEPHFGKRKHLISSHRAVA
jgi:hypothetical protein